MAQLRILRFTLGVTGMDTIRNEFIGRTQIRRFGNTMRSRDLDILVMSQEEMLSIGNRMLKMGAAGQDNKSETQEGQYEYEDKSGSCRTPAKARDTSLLTFWLVVSEENLLSRDAFLSDKEEPVCLPLDSQSCSISYLLIGRI